jgi:succinyl-CoA synthetase beta subunit
VEAHPEAVWQGPVDPVLGLPLFMVRDGLDHLGLSQALAQPLHQVAAALHAAFRQNAATLAEINPLAVTPQGPVALDARMVIDESALESLPEMEALVREDPAAFPEEHLKLSLGFDYVEIDPEGDVGLLSTGAGLTMTVIDLIARRGGRPINFSDLRTGSMGRDPTRLNWVLERLSRCPNLRSVLVNVFAGITNLENFAHALLAAVEARPDLARRLVVRATGTGFTAAAALWRAAGLTVTEDLEEAVNLALEVGRP